jgi:hypothetical protein
MRKWRDTGPRRRRAGVGVASLAAASTLPVLPTAPASGTARLSKTRSTTTTFFSTALTQALGVNTNADNPSTAPLPATTRVDWVRAWQAS